jgi:hypothetical protein
VAFDRIFWIHISAETAACITETSPKNTKWLFAFLFIFWHTAPGFLDKKLFTRKQARSCFKIADCVQGQDGDSV